MERIAPCLEPGIDVDAGPSDILCTIDSLCLCILRTAVECSWHEGSLISDTALSQVHYGLQVYHIFHACHDLSLSSLILGIEFLQGCC